MGNFYVNVTLLDVPLDAVQEMAPRPSFVGAFGPDVIVFAAADDAGAPVVGADLTGAMGCAGISVGVHDDDILFWEVHRYGETIASGAVPDPAEYFDLGVDEMADMMEMMGEAPPPGSAGRMIDPRTGVPVEADEGAERDPATELVASLGRGDIEAVRAVLTADHVFATDRHAAFVAALGLPSAAVGWGHRYIEEDGGGDGPSAPSVVHLA